MRRNGLREGLSGHSQEWLCYWAVLPASAFSCRWG